MIKVKSYLKQLIYWVGRKFNLVNSNYYRIDGGLGSQIIGYLIYSQAKKNFNNIFLDTSFFRKKQSDSIFLTNTHRSWGLDSFGITLDSLNFESKITFWNKLRLKPDDISFGRQFEKFMFSYDPELSKLIPNLGYEKSILLKYEIENNNYSVVHIRKGDFKFHASYLVNDSFYLNLLVSLNSILTNYVFVVSDENLGESFEHTIRDALTNTRVIFEYSSNELETHGLMRNARVLVTSNSMFSLSAAILRDKNLLTITPKIFFGKKFESYNRGISSLSNWNII
jgi:hypothetical protein